MMTFRGLGPLSVALCASILNVPQSVAEDAPQAVLEEVVVTARRRAESMQETPLAVTAVSSEMMEQAGISSVADVERLTPNLQFSQTNYKAPAVFIRGIGQRSGNPVLDPGVGMYLNGVYVPRSDAQLLEAVDVAGIQVLRGPQGTLFGKNNIGGAILVDSKKPDPNAFELGVRLNAGSHGRRDGRLSANIPIAEDSLGLRLALNSKRVDGYVDNIDAGNALFDEDRMALSSRLLWYVDDAAEVDLFGYVSRVDERGSPYNCFFQNDQAILTFGIYRGQGGGNLRDACDRSSTLAPEFKVKQNGEDAVYAIDNQMLALSVRWMWGELEAENITSYAMQDNIRISGDSDGTDIHSVHVGPNAGIAVFNGAGQMAPFQERNQFTQELKFNGLAWNERLNYTFGVFYAREELTDSLDGTDVGDNGLVAVGGEVAVGIPVPEDMVLPVQANAAALADYENTTSAVFAQGSWDMTDWLQLTLGLRYTEEKRISVHTQYTPDYEEYGNRLNAQIGSDPQILLPVTHVMDGIYSPVPVGQYLAWQAPEVPLVASEPIAGEATFTQLTPAMTLNFIAPDALNDAVNLDSFIAYLTVSDGFKSGGLDVRSTQTEQSIQQFEPEMVTNTELGFKLDALDRKLRFNFALYHLDYEDLQVALYERGTTQTEVVQFTGNAGEAVVDGFELELTALLGNITVNANAGYADGDFEEYNLGTNTPDGFAIIDRSDEAFPQVPQNVRGLMLQYDWHTGIGLLVPQLQYYYSDEIFIGTDYLSGQFANSTISQYELYNARLFWEISDRANVTAYVNNLKDDHYYVGGIAVTSVIGVGNRVPGLPRHFGVEVSLQLN